MSPLLLLLLPLVSPAWTGGEPFPDRVVGMYLNLADNTFPGYHDEATWTPRLYPYQQDGANVIFLTFINPDTMVVPLAFRSLAATRGTEEEGAVPAGTTILFAVGGALYSEDPNPWAWLETREAAEAMALQVAHWKHFGADGIDLDLESGAGDQPAAGVNMYYFIEKLRSYLPDFIITQPTFGYPQIPANNFVINHSWDEAGRGQGLADTVGIMAYGEETGDETESLDYVKNFADATSQWNGFPITVNVPRPSIMVGCKGSAAAASIAALAEAVVDQDLLGIMVWYCSVKGGFQYEADWDGSYSVESQEAFRAALSTISRH